MLISSLLVTLCVDAVIELRRRPVAVGRRTRRVKALLITCAHGQSSLDYWHLGVTPCLKSTSQWRRRRRSRRDFHAVVRPPPHTFIRSTPPSPSTRRRRRRRRSWIEFSPQIARRRGKLWGALSAPTIKINTRRGRASGHLGVWSVGSSSPLRSLLDLLQGQSPISPAVIRPVSRSDGVRAGQHAALLQMRLCRTVVERRLDRTRRS